jgi:hypothetical protein
MSAFARYDTSVAFLGISMTIGPASLRMLGPACTIRKQRVSPMRH